MRKDRSAPVHVAEVFACPFGGRLLMLNGFSRRVFLEDKMIEWMAHYKTTKAVGHETLPLASITHRDRQICREH